MQGCAPQPEPEKPDRLVLRPVSFRDLPGWEADDHVAALHAFKRSCAALEQRADDEPLDIAPLGGRVGDWRGICAEAAALEGAGSARAFFESRFTSYEARNNAQAQGLFTGYFEPELRGALREDARYRVPLYRRPQDLVSVDLGLISDRARRRADRRPGRGRHAGALRDAGRDRHGRALRAGAGTRLGRRPPRRLLPAHPGLRPHRLRGWIGASRRLRRDQRPQLFRHRPAVGGARRVQPRGGVDACHP